MSGIGGGDSACSPEELATQYRVKKVQLVIAGYILEIMKVADLDELLEKVETEDQIPFWAELWPGALGLSRYILEHKSIWAGKDILELGAGVGLAGIAARLAGARVVHSDFSPEALRFIRCNYMLNGLGGPELLLADFRDFPVEAASYDMILGADILYEKNLHSSLINIFTRVLKPGGSIYLSDPGRLFAREFCELEIVKTWQLQKEQVITTHNPRELSLMSSGGEKVPEIVNVYRFNLP